MSRRPTSARPRPKAAAALPRTLELTIDSVGGRGDGIARHGDEQVFIPGTIPGERVVVKVEGRRGDGLAATLLQVLTPAEGRQAPPCRHFGVCGGCSLQHMTQALYQDWKRGQLVEAMGRAGFGPELIAPLVAVPPGSRRRAAFAFSKRRKQLHLGFNARASHQLVNLEECPLLAPELFALLDPLRAVLLRLLDEGGEGDAVATLTENGIDLLIEAEARLDLFDRETLAAFAEDQNLARLSWRRSGGGPAGTGMIEPLAHRRPAVVRFAGIGVEPPPASFLQPSLEGERALAALVFDAVGAKGPVADLFSGCGSFTFPLAQKAQVHAVEGDEAALRALKAAADHNGSRVSTELRDLARRPLLAEDLKKYQAVVFDPPRAGAAAQAEHLAEAGPALVVAVSCNPATLARDARILARGGYVLKRATPVDQFPWSAHLEAVAVFGRS